jgi:hypothetical protein
MPSATAGTIAEYDMPVIFAISKDAIEAQFLLLYNPSDPKDKDSEPLSPKT